MNDREHPCNQGGRCAFWLRGKCSLTEERPGERCSSYINLSRCEYSEVEYGIWCDTIIREQEEKQKAEFAAANKQKTNTSR